MSWDVMVFDFGGNRKPLEEMTEDDRPRTIGSVADVRAKIDAHLPGVDWSDPTRGIYIGEGFSFGFNVGDKPETEGFMVLVRGGGDAVASLLKFAVPNGWSLLDLSTSEWIDPNDPSHAGWEGFQAFRDRALERHRSDEAGE